MARTLGLRCTLAAAAAVALLCAALPSARAQQPQPSLTIAQLDDHAYPAISAVITPLDASGVPVRGLAPAQIQAFDGAAPLTVTAVTAAQDQNAPLSVVLTLDISGSMAGRPPAP